MGKGGVWDRVGELPYVCGLYLLYLVLPESNCLFIQCRSALHSHCSKISICSVLSPHSSYVSVLLVSSSTVDLPARRSTHTVLGWTTWVALCFIGTTAAFVLAVALPIFSYLIGITASLFAAWYTYGLAGFFWIHDTYHLHGGRKELCDRPVGMILAILTILAGAFICVAGTYVSVQVCSLLHSMSRATVLLTFSSVDHRCIRRRNRRGSIHMLVLVEIANKYVVL